MESEDNLQGYQRDTSRGNLGSGSQARAARWALEIPLEGAVWWKSYQSKLNQTFDGAGQWNYSCCMLEWL